MTPFESLLWNVWLPKVRASVNNEWSADHPQPMIKLYEAWSTFLPAFIRDNILDQLILPKVQKAVAEWNSKTATGSLRSIVFPWLPYVGLRLEDVVGDARRKIKSLLRSWTVDAPIPMDLIAWKDVRAPSLHPSLKLIFFYRYSTRATGIICSSNTSSPSLVRRCVQTSVSILGIKSWSHYNVYWHGLPCFDSLCCPNCSRPNSSPNGSTSSTSGLSNPKSASRKWLSGIRSGRVHSRTRFESYLASAVGSLVACN